MELTKEVLKQLAAPFPSSAISVKVQTKPNDKGNALCVAYIDARDVMDRLDEVVGGEWSDDYRVGPAGGLECALTICGITRRDVGIDDNPNNTEKAGYSDAFKRAAVKFGIGRFLYTLPKMYGKVKQVGNNYYLDDGEEVRLRNSITLALNGNKPPKAEKKEAENPSISESPSMWTVAQKNVLIDAGLAKNDFSAKGMLGLSNLPINADAKQILAWGKLYHERRTTTNEATGKPYLAPEAASYANGKAEQ